MRIGLGISIPVPAGQKATGGSAEFVGPLDDMATSLAVAYSLRRLLASYEGPAIRVRESGGDTEADIGFTADGDLDTDALLAHCGANSGYVAKWYDQSGNGQDAAQATGSKQPRVVNSGVAETGMRFVKADQSVLVVPDSATVSLGADTDFTHLSWVYYLNATDRVWHISKGPGGGPQTEEYTLDVNDTRFAVYVGNGTTGTNADSAAGHAADQWYQTICQHDSVADEVRVILDDGTPAVVAWSGGTQNNESDLVLGAYSGGAFFLDGYFNEFVLWKRVLSGSEITATEALGAPIIQ